MKNLFVVVGGLGKNIIWTSLIEQLNVKCGENISVMTPWPFVFYNNKNIDHIEPLRDFPFNEQLTIYDDIIYHEPYFSDFLKYKDKHVLESWAQAYGIENVINKPYLNHNLDIGQAHKYLSSELLNDYCIVQFSGAPNYYDANFGDNKNNIGKRDYRPDLAEKLVHKIKNNLKLDVICLRRDDQYKPSAAITYTSKDEEGVLDIIPLIDGAKFIVCIDSALMHLAATTNNNKVIVLWNETQQNHKRIGYDFQINLSCSNDMCNDISPDIIFDTMENV